MSTDAAIDRVKSELNRAFDRTHADLERVEILAAGLAAFNTPIPPYEPRFHHLQRFNLSAHELPSQRKLRPDSTLFSGTNTGRKPLTDDG
jgi:hypothetical protein